MSLNKVQRVARKSLSIGLTATTALWLTGSSFLVAVPAAYALGNEAVVTDVTGSNPRIAASGESERVFLGINLARTDNTDVVQLGFMQVRLTSGDGAADEAAVANVEEVRLYRDSSLSGTNGIFDENDGLINTVTRTEGGANATTMTTQVAISAAAASSVDAGADDLFCVLDAESEGDLVIGDAVAVYDASTGLTYYRVITAVDEDQAGSCGAATSDEITLDTVLPLDLGLDVADTIIDLANYPAGITAVNLTDATGIGAADSVKLGLGVTAEVRSANALVGTVLSFPATTYVHANLEDVREVNDENADNIDEFDVFAAGETAVQLGDYTVPALPDDAMSGTYDVPKTDSSDEAGDDVFVALLTDGGIDAQTVAAQVWTGDIGYRNITNAGNSVVANISTGTNTTDGTTVDVEFGADGTAPQITKVETYDNDKDGNVDRVKVYFDESMAADEMGTLNFQDVLGVSGDASQISANGSGGNDIDLAATGTWSTTTVLNDTLQIDFTGDVDSDAGDVGNATYSDANNSTGDTWSFIYDEDGGVDVMKDATGENLLDTTITTVDMARPEMIAVVLKDNDGNDRVDSLEVTWSEKLSSSSDVAGYTLTNTTENPDKDYTLGAVTSFKKSDGADSNTDDTMVIAVTELSDDVNDAFNLDYTASATVTDVAGNEGNSQTNQASPVDVEPRIEKVEYRDANSNGQIDSALITFTRAVDSDDTWEANFSLSEGYTVNAGTTTDADDTTTLTLGINESGSADTEKTPELTYTKPGDVDVCLDDGVAGGDCDGASETDLESVVAGDVVEEDDAPPVLLTATFYDGDNDTIWENGETLQFLFSEGLDANQIATGWNQNGADGSVFTDWQLDVNAGDPGAVLGDALVPDSGTISVTGRVVNLSATDDATTALNADDEVSLIANEIKDMAGNSALVDATAAGVTVPRNDLEIDTNPSAPLPLTVETRDMDGNGVLDTLEVEFGGMIAASSITMSEWEAARSANNFATENVVPDLTVTSVVTVSGGDDTRVLVSFNEANEGTGTMPEVKYVGAATLQDLAGNDIADFNHNAADDTEFEQGITYASTDGADPVVVLKRLRDRNMNGQYDQLVVVFSEAMAVTLPTDGWDVSDEALASAGVWSANTGDYDAYTFAALANVFKSDILEGGAPTALPSVTYASTGAFSDTAGRVLGDVLAGGEESPDIAVFAAPPVSSTPVDGELFQLTGGDGSVWIAKVVGTKKFRRHVLWGDFDTIYPHLAPMWPVAGVDQATYDMYTLSAWLRVAGTAPVYEVNDDMTAHWITCDDDPVDGQDCANEWAAAGGDPDGIYEINGIGGEWDRLTQTNDVVLPDVTN